MDILTTLIQEYGYIIVFLFTLLEGETIVALAGFAAHQGYLDLAILFPVVILGALIGDQSFFYFGRFKGKQYLAGRPELEKKVERIHLLLERYHGWIIFGSRFMYGFRTIIPIALGTSRVSGVKFFLFNLLGALVWASVFLFGGYEFGDAIETFLGSVKRFEGLIMGSVLTVVLGLQLALYLRKRSRTRASGETREI